MNFFMQMNAQIVASMPDAYRAIVETPPAWATGAFASAVFGGALGGVLLLLRKSIAVYVFVVSFVGAAQLPSLGRATSILPSQLSTPSARVTRLAASRPRGSNRWR
jgi:hypothetical protein